MRYTENKTEDDLEKLQELKDAVLLRFEIIGEAARQLPKTFKNEHKDIRWTDISGMRNKIIHEYFGINWYLIWKTIREDLPILKKQIEEILQ